MFIGSLHGTIHFTNYDSNITVGASNSKVFLTKADNVIGWAEFSIIKQFGENGATGWTEKYFDGVTISQEGSQEPNTNLIISNSNALNYGLKNNSNAIAYLSGMGGGPVFSQSERDDLLDTVRTTSNGFLYCCKNTSNALIYGLTNNSNAIQALLPGAFSEFEKFEALEDIRTTSNAFLYCCKNASNALSYGIKNNSNAIINLLVGEFTIEERAELVEHVRTTSNAFLYCCKNTSNALSYGIKNNSNAIMNFPLKLCGCCDGCEPVARALDYARELGLSRMGDDGCECPLACLASPSRRAPCSRALPGFAQGYAGHGRANGGVYPECVDGTNGSCVYGKNTCMRMCMLDDRASKNSGVTSAWSPDKKYLAVVTEVSGKEQVCVYVQDSTAEDGLRFVTHAHADENVHICSVAWGSGGDYLGIGFVRDEQRDTRGVEQDVFVYLFDKTQEQLQHLPDMQLFVDMF